MFLFLALMAAALLANLAILALRLRFVVHQSDLFETTGTEGVGIYDVWKAKNGYVLYEWPDRGNYSMSIFNYLLYTLDGFVLRLFRVPDMHIPSMARLITLVFAILGILAHRAIAWRVIPRILCNRRIALLTWLVIASAWIGRASTSWWILTVRPDIPALAMAMFGVLFLFRHLEGKSIWNAAIASLMFYLAWCFKQSFFLTIFLSILYLLITGRWKAMLWLCIPYGVCCAATLWIGGPVFWRNVVFMTALAPWDVRSGIVNVKTWMILNPIYFAAAIFSPLALRCAKKSAGVDSFAPAFDSRQGLLFVGWLAVATIPLSIVGSCRVGSSYNYFFEPMTYLAILTCAALAWCMHVDRSPVAAAARTVVLAVGAWAMAVPILTLACPHGVGPFTWNLAFSNESVQRRSAFAAALEKAPHPVLIDDTMLAEPWLATNDAYPALVTDSEIFLIAQNRGLIPKNIRSDLVLRGVYRSAVAPRGSKLGARLLSSGFTIKPLPPYTNGAGAPGDHEMVLFVRQ